MPTTITRTCGLALGLLLAAAFPAPAAEAPLVEPATESSGDDPDVELEEVVVYAVSGELVAGLYAESELDEEGIAAYGADTVGELLAQVAPDVDNSEEGPVILINGKPANGIRSVNDLPPESIASVQVLPPQAAAAIGESPTRRVINVVLKTQFKQGTGSLTARGATAGRGTSSNGNYSMVKLVDGNIRNISFYASQTSPLLESQRRIQTQTTVVPYDLIGNVVSWPVAGSEIDAGLSAAAGSTVTVAGVPPGLAMPGLGDFSATANNANTSDLGRYRSLIGESYSIGLNGNTGRQLPHRISLNMNANLDYNQSRSRTGATSTLLHVPASSPFTPFGSDVGIARYLGDPLQQDRDSLRANVSVNLNTQIKKWRLLSDSNFSWNRSVTDSERRVDLSAVQAEIDAGTRNPFEPLPDAVLDNLLSDHARGRGYTMSSRMLLSGGLFDMPAGKANANLSLQWQQTGQRSRTVGTNNVSSKRTRVDQVAYLTVQLPLFGSPQSQGFGMGADVNGAARRVTASGTLYTYGYGVNARNGNRVQLRVGYNRERQAPTPNALNDPVVIIDDYRTYDFIRDETVLVRYITGGNPGLKIEDRDIISVSGQVRPIKTTDFTLNAQYTRTIYHDPMAALPPPSLEVQAAFPDRFRRDADGRLYEIDARAVNFVRTRNEQFRWGGNFRKTFGGPKGPQPGQVVSSSGMVMMSGDAAMQIAMLEGAESLSGAGLRLNANFTHYWQMAYKRVMRAGLPVVDLLKGSAGFSNPQSRHRVQTTLGMAYNGTGMQMNTSWTGASHLDTGTPAEPNRLDFSSTLQFTLQAFTNLDTWFPERKSLKGVRLTLNVENLLDSWQHVKDQNGATPLRYQRYLLNPLGRTISLSFRKAFSQGPAGR